MSDDPLDCYVIAEIEGPFGPIKQMSGLMRPSEAAMTAADLGRPDKGREMPFKVLSVKAVQIKKRPDA